MRIAFRLGRSAARPGARQHARSMVARAAKTVENMRWFEVVNYRGTIDGGSVSEWQVTIKVGFTLK